MHICICICISDVNLNLFILLLYMSIPDLTHTFTNIFILFDSIWSEFCNKTYRFSWLRDNNYHITNFTICVSHYTVDVSYCAVIIIAYRSGAIISPLMTHPGGTFPVLVIKTTVYAVHSLVFLTTQWNLWNSRLPCYCAYESLPPTSPGHFSL